MRKITSLTALISFVVLVLNSVALYIAPHGRVANWTDWRFWGLTKTEWANQHIIIGILFLLAIFLHIYYNWKPIVAYLRNKLKKFTIFTHEFNIALILVIICTVGAYVEVQPFNWVLILSESIKDSAARNHGDPPYGRAELSSLEDFTERVGLDLQESRNRLQNAGIHIQDDQQTLLEIATQNNTTPNQLYLLMKPEDPAETGKIFPDEPEKGFGNRRLTEICSEYGLSMPHVLEQLASSNIIAGPDQTIRQIAEQNQINTRDVFTSIRKGAVADE